MGGIKGSVRGRIAGALGVAVCAVVMLAWARRCAGGFLRGPRNEVAPNAVRFALVQYATPTNTAEVAEGVTWKVDYAFRQGARYVLLPEFSFVGVHGLMRAQETAREVESCGLVPVLAPIARRHRGYVVLNHFIRESNQVFNASIVLGPSGTVENVHRKTVRSTWDVRAGLVTGDRFELFETPHGAIGLIICRAATDLLLPLEPTGGSEERPPSALRLLAQQARAAFSEAQVVVIQLAHAGRHDPDINDTTVQDLLWESPFRYVDLAQQWARETGSYVALVNKCGRERRYTYGGHSCVVAPDGHLLGSAGYAPGLLLVDLPLGPDGRIDPAGEVVPHTLQTDLPFPSR